MRLIASSGPRLGRLSSHRLGTVRRRQRLAQGDPAVGTWKLNVAKSRYSPGPAPKSNVITIAAAGDTLKISSQGVDGSRQTDLDQLHGDL